MKFHNSTVIIGDSNTELLAFCDVDDSKEKANGTFGRAMPGMRVDGYKVGEINPFDALGLNAQLQKSMILLQVLKTEKLVIYQLK